MPADFLEDPSSSKFLPSITSYKDYLDLFISYKFRVDVSYLGAYAGQLRQGPHAGQRCQGPIMDWEANQDVKLDTCQSLLGAGICYNQRGFLPALGFSSPTSSSHHPCKPPLQVFISGAAEWSDSFLSLFNSTDVLSTGLKTCLE